MKKSNKAIETAMPAETTAINEQPQVSSDVNTAKSLGRPANPSSARQQKAAARQAAIDAGSPITRGRKPVEGSKRQIKLAKQAELRASGLLTGKRGRPVVPGSKHQASLAEKQAMINANGGVPRMQGRPKYTAEQAAAAKAIKDAAKAAAKVSVASTSTI